MTERKPPGLPFESWVDRQIREAAERGAFADLPGAGKPLSGEGAPYDEMWWVKEKMRREGVSCLPPSLVLRKEADEEYAAALRARTEEEVRRRVAALNDRLRRAVLDGVTGPTVSLAQYDVDDVVREWRAGG
ncbi:DUF1992 domain-containing protein [Streptomyces sp. DSM 42041]|uniref:DUF1992 domain-containing protein n=1 Tax=Streptomyces hazeniae TaxID=3075538 RepID=A0ABU2NLN7_9ACTN|nr:DUF1992 domain-containing protein [Streptomyces sp. DSM 42041]MDT0377891.1 DUF1992 domain-containing protein [Streptomyces sp. DSM 42041]